MSGITIALTIVGFVVLVSIVIGATIMGPTARLFPSPSVASTQDTSVTPTASSMPSIPRHSELSPVTVTSSSSPQPTTNFPQWAIPSSKNAGKECYEKSDCSGVCYFYDEHDSHGFLKGSCNAESVHYCAPQIIHKTKDTKDLKQPNSCA